MSRIARSLLISSLLVSLTVPALAEDRAVDPWTPPPDQTGFTMFPSTRVPGAWGFDGMLWLDYGLDTLEPSSGSGTARIMQHRFAGAISGQIGLWGRGALALRMPAVLMQSGDDVAGPSLASQAIGNPALDGRVRVIGAASRPDGSVEDGAALAVRGVLTLPVGTSNAYFADDFVRTELSLIADVQAFGLGAGASLGYRHRFHDDRESGSNVSFQDQLRLAGGLKIPFPLVAIALPGKVQESALVELDVGTDPRDFFAKYTTPVEARLSYRIIVSDFAISLGGGASLGQALGVPDLRVLMGVSYSPRKHDQDADGVADGDDQCEHLAEDLDGFEDDDGCPEPDNDQDMILDEDDRCPNEAAEIGRDEDEDGCTDA